MTDWWYQRNARMILIKYAKKEMHIRDALARLEALHEGKGRGVDSNYGRTK
jgi:hypothetical protein